MFQKGWKPILAILLVIGLLWPAMPAQAARTQFVQPGASVFINEIHYDNTGTDAGEAIEIAGPAGTNLSGWTLVLYNGSGGAVYDTDVLSGIIPDQQNGFGTLSFSYPVNGIQNGAPDGIALVDPTNAVVMFLSYEGTFTAVGGAANGLTSTSIGVSETGSEPLGLSLQLTGNGATYSDFTWTGPVAHTFGTINAGQSFGAVVNIAPTISCGANINTYTGLAVTRGITAVDQDGIVTDISLVSVDPLTDAITLSGLTPASEVGQTAAATLDISAAIPAGTYSLLIQASNNDTAPQTAVCNLTVTVTELLTIGEVQGQVADDAIGTSVRSPYAPPTGNGNGETVFVRGVITERVMSRTSAGVANYGFFLQSTPDSSDGDPLTSDGIFVFHGRFTTLLRSPSGSYTPQVGDEVILGGPVVEYFNLTQLSNPRLYAVLRSGVDLEVETPVFEANPPDDLAEANRYWERREGMRAAVMAGSIVLSNRAVFASSADGEFWLAHPDSAIAQRVDPYTRRAFRDPHPYDDIPAELFDNGNGYRIILGSLGIKFTYGDSTLLLPEARTFDTMLNTTVGGVYFSFNKYQIMVSTEPVLESGVDPDLNAPPMPIDMAEEYAVVTFNMENLYDFRDDPFDGCDFAGNAGCPGVNPPFDYVPASQVTYQTRVETIARQIVEDLHSPDLILVQEAEDQDICILNSGMVECGTINGADGQPDALQDLAAAILGLGGPEYASAFDRDGADDRGIVSAFLFRTDRVELLPVDAGHAVLGSDPAVMYPTAGLPFNSDVENPKALNAELPDDLDTSTGVDGSYVFTRAPQVGLFRVWRDSIGQSVFTDLVAISNHFSSTPTGRVAQRTEQAAYNAAIVDALEMAYPGLYVTVGGDLNVYPRPDDAFAPGNPRFPSDQLGPLYEEGLINLYDVLLAEVPVSAYSYIFEGQAQTLDQLFANPGLFEELVTMRAAHINSDWSENWAWARGTSDHDPQVAVYNNLVTLSRLRALLDYYFEIGMFRRARFYEIVAQHLDQAEYALSIQDYSTYEDQLMAFRNQVRAFSPIFLSQFAADVLVQETTLLINMH